MELAMRIWLYLESVPVEFWQTVGTALVTSGVISLVLQFIKKKFQIDGKKLVATMLSTMTFLASVTQFLVTNNPGSPLPEIAQYWAYVMAGAVILHRFFVSPLYRRVETALRNFQDKVEAYKEEKYSAPLPDRTIDAIVESLQKAEVEAPKLAE